MLYILNLFRSYAKLFKRQSLEDCCVQLLLIAQLEKTQALNALESANFQLHIAQKSIDMYSEWLNSYEQKGH